MYNNDFRDYLDQLIRMRVNVQNIGFLAYPKINLVIYSIDSL